MAGKALTTGWCCFWLVACAGRASAPPQRTAPTARLEQTSEECRTAGELRRDAHQRVQAGQWFAAARRLAKADRLCKATQASTADARLAETQLASPPGETSQSLLDQARAASLAGNAPQQLLLEERAARLIEQAAGVALAPRLPTADGDRAEYAWSPDSGWLFERSEDGIALRRRDEWYPRFQASEHGANRSGNETLLSPDIHALLDFEKLGEERGAERWVSIVDVAPGADFAKRRARFATVDYPPPVFSADNARLVFAEATRPGSGRSTLTVVNLATGAVERRVEPPTGTAGVSSLMLGDVGRSAVVRWTDSSLSVVDLATGAAWHHAGSTALHDTPFSPDERFVIFADHAYGDANHLLVYDTVARRARPLAMGTCSLSGQLVYDQQSQLAAIGSFDGELCLLELASGKLRKLPIKTPLGMALPQRFMYGTQGLLLANRDVAILLNVASGEQVATFPDMMGLLQINQQPTVISTRGTFAVIEPQLRVRQVDPQPRPAGLAGTATVIGPELALRFDSSWLIAHAASGKIRSFDFPPLAESLPNESPDAAYLAFTAGPAPEIYTAASGKRAAHSPVAFGAAPQRLLATEGPERSESETKCTNQRLRDPSGAVELVRQKDDSYALLECASGQQGAPFALPDYPSALLGPARALLSQDGLLVVWDLKRGAPIGHVPWELNNLDVFALSADDRYLFAGNALWDVGSQQHLLKLAYWPQAARFVGQSVLLTGRGVTTDLWRAPSFAHTGAAFTSRDGESTIAFAFDAKGAISALTTRGAREAWDTTFGCGAGSLGVPFRICRQALEQSGLLQTLLE